MKKSAPRDPSQKPPSSLESAFDTEKNDATIVGIGRQQLEKNTQQQLQQLQYDDTNSNTNYVSFKF